MIHSGFNIKEISNGYLVTYNDPLMREYAFQTLEAAFEHILNRIKPTHNYKSAWKVTSEIIEKN